MRRSNYLIAFIFVVIFSSINKVAIGSEISDGKYKFDKEKNIELGHKPDDVTVMLQIFPWITIKNNKLIISAGECILPSKKCPSHSTVLMKNNNLSFFRAKTLILVGEKWAINYFTSKNKQRFEPKDQQIFISGFRRRFSDGI